MSSCKLGRNAEFQAIIPVRGKTLNCMKSSYDKIFASDIIVDLLKVIGCGVEVKTGKKSDLTTFDYSLLKWNKIIICTDADEDGFQIRTLLLTMFYRLLPTLIEKGKIFIAESPLFEITSGGETYFAYNEFEKAEILEKLGNKKYTEDELSVLLASELTPIYVAVDETDDVCGYAFCVYQEIKNNVSLMDMKTLYIDDLCVDETKRGQHIGSMLYEYVLAQAKQMGCYHVTLNVWCLNESAMNFYKKCGLSPLKITMEQIL